MDEKKKQERLICHLELNGEHYYFGNLKALTDYFGKEDIGISYKSLANYFSEQGRKAREDGNESQRIVFKNNHCIIRRDAIITSTRKE